MYHINLDTIIYMSWTDFKKTNPKEDTGLDLLDLYDSILMWNENVQKRKEEEKALLEGRA